MESDTLLGDQQRDKDFAKNQLLAVILMTALMMGWFYFYGPKPPQQPPAPVETAQQIERPESSQLTSGPEVEPVVAESPVAAPAEPATVEPAEDLMKALEYDPETAPGQRYTLSNGTLDLEFTDIGARLVQSTVVTVHGANQPLVPTWGDTPEDEAVYPLSLSLPEDDFPNVNHLRWTAEENGAQALSFHLNLPEPYAARITKTFRLSEEHPNVLDLEVTYTNTGSEARRLGLDDKEPSFELFWGPNVNSGDAGNYMVHQEIVWRENNSNTHTATSKLPGFDPQTEFFKSVLNPEWVAIKSAYFIVAMRPEFEGARGLVDGEPEHFLLSLTAPRVVVPSGESETRSYEIYLGPVQGESLAKAWPSLKSSLEFFTMFGFMDTFAKGMLYVLNWFYNSVYANYGFAIIFLTLLVRLAMFPLTLKGMKSMKKMQKLAPEMEKIKEKAGDDQQEMQRLMMEMYRERGVNPLGGCMPMLLQMPVFIALYRVYATAYEFRGAPFIGWITDLSEPDAFLTLPFTIPVPFTANGIDSFNLLPILMALAMVASTKLMPTSGPVQNPQQKMIMTLMPIFFSVICYNMAAGLNLYILTSTLLGIAQNYFVRVSDEEVDSKPGKAKVQKMKRRKKHFYAAAQDKKREIAREERREKKKKKGRGGKQQPGGDRGTAQ